MSAGRVNRAPGTLDSEDAIFGRYANPEDWR